jgi:hypothetical protein
MCSSLAIKFDKSLATKAASKAALPQLFDTTLLQRCVFSACAVLAMGQTHAAWVTVFPPLTPIELRVFAEPGAQVYSRFDPQFKVVSPRVSGGCPDNQTLKEGWIYSGGVYGIIPMSASQQRFGQDASPTIATIRVDMLQSLKMPPDAPIDGNSANTGAQRTGGLKVPVAACNAHLSGLSSSARAAAARNGFNVALPKALPITARVDCTGSYKVDAYVLPVTMKCEPAPALINRVSLRVEWSQQEACPSEVRLIGVIDGNFNHVGKRIFMGNQYLGGYEPYQIGSGQMTVVETRKLNWAAHAQGALAPAPGTDATMDGWAQLNVQPDNALPGAPALFTSERVSYRVTCKKEQAPRALPTPAATPQPPRARALPPTR